MAFSFGKFALSCCFLAPLPLAAWWETGHQAIARIAAFHLTSSVRARVALLLDVADSPEAVADALAKASTWADETKKETGTSAWHYIDLALQDTRSDIALRCKDDDCAPARIRLFARQLSSKTVEHRWSDQDALRYVVHFVGDIHQPLHTISDADLGGNCERLEAPVGQAKNLHALWDGELVNELNLSDRALAAELENGIQRLTDEQRRSLAAGSVDDWVWQSHELALADVYRVLRIPVEPVEFPASCNDAPLAIGDLQLRISTGYMGGMKPVVRDQLTKAGLRLATLLNETLGEK
jgi:hypothetical protein